MADYLVFTLTATLAAMGDLAGHERRGSLTWPGRSALLGLLGAAMGLPRDGDFAALDALHLAVAVFDEGQPLRDYHTVETVPSAAAKRPQSRPEAMALAKGRTNTTITLRDYRMGPMYGVAVWGGDLAALKLALERPGFTLYLGRKSCPLAAPVGARLVDFDSPEAALSALQLPPWRAFATATRLILDATDSPDATHTEQRHDQPLDRAKWHFAPRQVAFREVHITPGGGGMTLYLSRLRLSRSPSTQALNAILNPPEPGLRLDAHHRLIWAVFADDPDRRRDFLWRDEGEGRFLTLSARPPLANDLFDAPEVKEFAPDLRAGDQLGFSLRANATRDRKGVGRVDVVMDALKDVPKAERAGLRMELAAREGASWLARHGEAAGFRPVQVSVGDYSVAALPSYKGVRKGQPQFGILDLTGVLEVTGPEVFLSQLAAGFGRAKAFGCGLMLIRRA